MTKHTIDTRWAARALLLSSALYQPLPLAAKSTSSRSKNQSQSSSKSENNQSNSKIKIIAPVLLVSCVGVIAWVFYKGQAAPEDPSISSNLNTKSNTVPKDFQSRESRPTNTTSVRATTDSEGSTSAVFNEPAQGIPINEGTEDTTNDNALHFLANRKEGDNGQGTQPSKSQKTKEITTKAAAAISGGLLVTKNSVPNLASGISPSSVLLTAAAEKLSQPPATQTNTADKPISTDSPDSHSDEQAHHAKMISEMPSSIATGVNESTPELVPQPSNGEAQNMHSQDSSLEAAENIPPADLDATAQSLSAPEDDAKEEQPQYQLTSLGAAIEKGNLKKVKQLIKGGANVNQADNEKTTTLNLAASYDHKEILIHLLKQPGIDVTCCNKLDRDAFMLACYYGSINVVKWWLESSRTEQQKPPSMSNDKHDLHGCTPLMLAIIPVPPGPKESADSIHQMHQNKFEVVKKLTPHRQYFNLNKKDNYGMTPLILAVKTGYMPLMNHFLIQDNIKDRLNDQDNLGSTPLIIARRMGLAEIARALIQAGADTNIQDGAGKTAADYAA